jgi:hypothetical protein
LQYIRVKQWHCGIAVGSIALAISAPSLAQQSELNLTFLPESGRFAEATEEYRALWKSDGRKITREMEAITGLRFTESA